MGTEYVGFLAVDWGKLSAAGLLAILPIVVLVLVLQRYLDPRPRDGRGEVNGRSSPATSARRA